MKPTHIPTPNRPQLPHAITQDRFAEPRFAFIEPEWDDDDATTACADIIRKGGTL